MAKKKCVFENVDVIEVDNLEQNLYLKLKQALKNGDFSKHPDLSCCERFSEDEYSRQVFDIVEGVINE